MALKTQASFAAGELDPALHERTTLQKYASGLATARNVIIGKTGRVRSRPGRKLFAKTKLSNKRNILYTIPEFDVLIEFGHLYARVYWESDDATSMEEVVHTYTEADLDSIQFAHVLGTVITVYIFCEGKPTTILEMMPGNVHFYDSYVFGIPYAPTWYTPATVANGSTGYQVDYIATRVTGGEESLVSTIYSSSSFKLPVAAADYNQFKLQVDTHKSHVTEVRLYRRPSQGGAFGYVGSSTVFAVETNGGVYATYCTIIDRGAAADYTHSPPTLNITLNRRGITGPEALLATTGAIYQQRLVMGSGINIEASRTGFYRNFYRDYPLGDDSSLSFKAGSTGSNVVRMIDADGLVVFTQNGVFLSEGALTPSNLALTKKGNWIIDRRVPPLALPGGVMFVDVASNCVRELRWAGDNSLSFVAEEISIFSNHLFKGNRIRSWAFQQGDTPLLWVVFENGEYAAFTYERDQEMRAWTRSDSVNVNVEYVASTSNSVNQFTFKSVPPKVFFLVEKNGERYIEQVIPRYVSALVAQADSESAMNESMAAMDSVVSWNGKLNSSLVGADVFQLAPLTTDIWDGPLTLTCGTSGLFTADGLGAVGTVFRFFHPEDQSSVTLEVTARTSDNAVFVMPSAEFPSAYATGFNLYQTKKTFTGLSHLNGEKVAVIVDGYVLGSPNNDIEDFPDCIPSGGSLTLPFDLDGAIVHIGRPFTCDVETLDVDSVEQRPVFIESQTLNKLYVKVYNSNGLYAGNTFVDNDKVSGMQALDSYVLDYELPVEVVGNRFQPPSTKRVELTVPGDWNSHGRVCLRQVDPLHFEVLSVIPDIEDLRR